MTSALAGASLRRWGMRAVIVLTEKDIEHRRTYIDLAAKPDWFLDLSPLGRVPVLQTDKAILFESQVIAEYLDEVTPGSLHPDDPLEKARHRSWIEFGSATLNEIAGLYNAPDAVAFAQKSTALSSRLERIAPEVAGPFFAGEQFHMIDGVWGTIFRYFDVLDQIPGLGMFEGLPDLEGWRAAVASRPSVAAAPPDGYQGRLERFLRARQSHIATLLN